MSKKFIAIAILGVFLFSSLASAQTNNMPLAGTTPGSPLFFLDRFFEDIGTFFTFGEANKARRYLALAEERLAEAQVLAEKQDSENTTKATELYEEQFAKAKERAGRTGEINLEAEVTDATTRHLTMLDEVFERVPEQAREQVRAAKARTVSGQIEALRSITQRDPEVAVDIFARAAEGRLNAAQARAGRGGDDEEEAEEVNEALEEYGKYAEFGREISTLAQGLQAGETTVEELVERATSHHRDVLRDVQGKVPPQAQQNIQRALDRAEQFEQNRSAIPANRGQSDAGPNETTPLPEAEQNTPGDGFRPESAGGNNENEAAEEIEVENENEQGAGGPPEDTPGRRP